MATPGGAPLCKNFHYFTNVVILSRPRKNKKKNKKRPQLTPGLKQIAIDPRIKLETYTPNCADIDRYPIGIPADSNSINYMVASMRP